MKKNTVLLLLVMLLSSCENRTKSISDLEEQSLKSKIHNDTIFGSLKFGMTENELSNKFNIHKDSKYNFDIKEISYLDFIASPAYYNDSLYKIDFRLLDHEYVFNDILNIYNLKYGLSDTTYIDNGQIYYYWLKGNLEIEINKWEKKPLDIIRISYLDLSKDLLGKDLIQDKVTFNDYWTKEYYEKIYLPRKQKNLKGI